MEVTYLANKMVFLKGKTENVLINPDKNILGQSKYSSRIIIFSGKDLESIEGQPNQVVLQGPGEYEIGGVEINGFSGGDEGEVIYTIHIDDLIVGYLGRIMEEISDKKAERISNKTGGGIDVLLMSISKQGKVENKRKMDWVKKWGVNYLIPIDNETGELEEFLDVVDREGMESVESLKVEKDKLPDGLEVVVLKQK